MKLYGKPKRYINSTDKVNNKVFTVSLRKIQEMIRPLLHSSVIGILAFVFSPLTDILGMELISR